MPEHLKPYQFRPGQPGGPGRPPSSRNKLTELAIRTLTADFEEHGAEAIQRVREKHPQVYLTAVVSLLPKHHVAEKISPFAEMSDAELEQLEQLLTDMRERDAAQLKLIEGTASRVDEDKQPLPVEPSPADRKPD